jgi:hypothetical protein
MPNTLPQLEAERSKILRHFTSLGDMPRFDRRCPSPVLKTVLPLR